MRIRDWSSEVCSSDLIGVEKAREPRRQIAIDAMAENQLRRLHRTRGIDMERQPRRMPPLKRLNGVGIDVALDLAGFIALTPDAALQFLERRGLAILVHPAEQHGDDLVGRKVRLPFGAAYLVEQIAKVRLMLP